MFVYLVDPLCFIKLGNELYQLIHNLKCFYWFSGYIINGEQEDEWIHMLTIQIKVA
jgi:hypothetical protein